MTKKYDLSVVIGRFQPIHNGHLELIKKAASVSHNILFVLGSCNKPRDIKNPFSDQERESMFQPVQSILVKEHQVDSHIVFAEDFVYNDQHWAASVQNVVDDYASNINADTNRIAIVGHEKDSSSFYLRMFPQWDFIESGNVAGIDATTVRELYFEDPNTLDDVKPLVPESTLYFLNKFQGTPEYRKLGCEKTFIDRYKSQFDSLPWPPIFVTTDAIVVCKGHVLMVRRKAQPGKGLMAFPGGFVNANEFILDSAIRELYEETKIKIPEQVVRGSIVDREVFDAPGRSLRGRTITHAYLINLKDSNNLPRVRGSDDADKAFWLPMSRFFRSANELFEDHFSVGVHMINKLGNS